MKLRFSLALISLSVLSAQSPNLSGVWKLNLEKSKVTGPPPTNHLLIIDQQGSKITESTGVFTARGETRSSATYNTDGKASMNAWRGLPMRSTATWDGSTFVIDSKVAGARPATMKEKYTLSPDGNTLTVDMVTTMNGKDVPQTMIFEKQAESAGEALRKPEATASTRYKNVQVLKDVSASAFMDAMRSFTMSLGVDCEHCHVQGNFAADDKPAKAMA